MYSELLEAMTERHVTTSILALAHIPEPFLVYQHQITGMRVC